MAVKQLKKIIMLGVNLRELNDKGDKKDKVDKEA